MAPVRTPFSALLTVMAVVATTLAQLDPCTSYIELNDDRRSVAYEVSQVDNFRTISDFNIITNGLYYRFTAQVGERIPTGPVDNDLCGTFYPITMTEQHPDGTTGVEERTVCARAYGRSDCFWNATIEVRFCINGSDSYIVYQLQQPPYGDMAYCAGEKEACPRGQVWVDDSCKQEYPVMTSLPVLIGPEVDDVEVQTPNCTNADNFFSHVSRFRFVCTVGYRSTDDDARFNVTFLVQNATLLKVTLRAGNLNATLYEDQLAGRIGNTVSCSVVSYWNGNSVHRSDELKSNTYWAGIYPNNSADILLEGKFPVIHQLKFISTIPVTCWHCKKIIEKCNCSNDCNLARRDCTRTCSITAKIMHTELGTESQCNLVISGRVGEVAVQVRQISGVTHARYDYLRFQRFPAILSYPSTFQKYKINDVKIITKDNVVDQTCTLITDPHITTFDSKYYHAFTEGIYLVWKNPSGYLEIQAKFVKCGNRPVSCISAVAVREFNNVISLDAQLIAVSHLKDDNPANNIYVISRENGQVAEIRLSSGIQITATKWKWTTGNYLNLKILAPASFKNKALLGLCGNYDGQSDNDLKLFNSNEFDNSKIPTLFTDSYRIFPHYFIKAPVKIPFADGGKMCDCKNGQAVCGELQDGVNSISGRITRITLKEVGNADENAKRRKRSISSHDGADDLVDPVDVYNYKEPIVDVRANITLEWPSASGITEEEAIAICHRQIDRSPIADHCSQHADTIINDIIQSCITDIQLTDEADVGTGMATFMEDVCISTIIAATNMSEQESVYDNITGRYVPDNLLSVVQMLCPNQCFGQGDCVDGSCVCHPGFSSIDCAVDLSLPPSITDSLGRGVCNMAIRACRKATLYGANILNSTELTCEVFISTQENDQREMQSVASGPAVYVTASEVSCQLPESPLHSADPGQDDSETSPSVHTWYLSLTNDRLIYSEPHRYTLYDSLCQTCLNATACSPKPGTCDISQLCYIDGDPHPDDICRQCRSDVSMTQWSLSDNSPPELTTTAIVTSLDSGEEQLKATDAEGHSITFRLISGSNVRVSEDGLLVWSALAGQDMDIEVAAMDQCGASVTNTVRITLAAENKSKWTTILAAVVGGCVGLAIVVAVTIIACKKCIQRGKVAYQDAPYRPNASDIDHAHDSIRPTSASSAPISVVPSSVPASRPMERQL